MLIIGMLISNKLIVSIGPYIKVLLIVLIKTVMLTRLHLFVQKYSVHNSNIENSIEMYLLLLITRVILNLILFYFDVLKHNLFL